MKRLFIITLLTAMCSTMFAQDVNTALDKLDKFVSSINVTGDTQKAVIDSLNAEYNTLISAYKAVKRQATDDQVQRYFSLKAQYKKRVAPYYQQRTGEAIEKSADKVSKWAKRQYKKAKGTIEGIKE